MDPDAYLLHQVHPLKLASDIAASAASSVLLWRGHPGRGLLIRYGLPAIASVVVVRGADLSALRDTARGRYVLGHMPPAAQALRLAGDTLMAIGASRRSLALTLGGTLTVLAGWSHGIPEILGRRSETSGPTPTSRVPGRPTAQSGHSVSSSDGSIRAKRQLG